MTFEPLAYNGMTINSLPGIETGFARLFLTHCKLRYNCWRTKTAFKHNMTNSTIEHRGWLSYITELDGMDSYMAVQM